MKVLANVVVFKICWVVCVLGGAHMQPLAGVANVTAAVAYHLYTAPRPGPELPLLLITAVIGACWDSSLVAVGWLVYPSGTLIQGLAPYWIIALWIVFATTFNVSLRFFKRHLLLSSLLGAIGGPLAFLVGERLNGVVFVNYYAAIVALAIGWALIMPLLLLLSNRWDGFRQDSIMDSMPVFINDRG